MMLEVKTYQGLYEVPPMRGLWTFRFQSTAITRESLEHDFDVALRLAKEINVHTTIVIRGISEIK